MGWFLKYLASFVAHALWQKAGGKGVTPPVRMPLPKGRSLPLPMIGPWQLMFGMWLLRKVWESHGSKVKQRLADAPSPIASKIGDLLPDPKPNAHMGVTHTVMPVSPPPAAHDTQPLNGQNLPSGSVLSGMRADAPSAAS